MKVEIQLTSGKSFIADLPTSVKLTEHFTLKEMANNSGNPMIPQYIINDRVELFLCMVEAFRVWFNRPFTPNCSYRQPAYNKSVGGIEGSLHTKALAIDIPFASMTDAQWKNIVAKWKSMCQQYKTVGEAGRYAWGFHLGIDVNYQKTFYTFDKR